MKPGMILAVMTASLTIGAAPAQRANVSSLAWMSGAWAEETPRGWAEERWSPPRGGVMLGTGLSGRGDAVRDYEYMRIAADADGTISFWGSPRGRTPVPFRLVSASATQAAFENPRHDYPTRIAYRRAGDTLVATISGPNGVNARSWRYKKAPR
jgi:hypothetical protein